MSEADRLYQQITRDKRVAALAKKLEDEMMACLLSTLAEDGTLPAGPAQETAVMTAASAVMVRLCAASALEKGTLEETIAVAKEAMEVGIRHACWKQGMH